MRARGVVRITAADVGRRVTLRLRLPRSEPGGPSMTDVVGVLLAWEAGVLRVERRDGTIAEIPEDALVAARAFPPS